jgi:hypothetical protein
VVHGAAGIYGGAVGGRWKTTLAAGCVLLGVAACSSPSINDDAAIACGWDEPPVPVVSAIDASAQQRSQNTQQARTRLEAAQRVDEVDDRFGALVEALSETAAFASELESMSVDEIERIPNERWDFAKYAQAAARDQCEQLAAVVDRDPTDSEKQ